MALSALRLGEALADRLNEVLPSRFHVVVMAGVIVAVDLLFFKDRFWARLTVNAGIVLIFVAFYFRFLKRR